MPGRGDEHNLILVEVDRLDLRVRQRAGEPDLHLVGEKHRQDLLRAAGAHDHVDAGVAAAEGVQDAGEDVSGDRDRRAQP